MMKMIASYSMKKSPHAFSCRELDEKMNVSVQ